VGIGGSFLTDEHTLDHWKTEFWNPKLLNRSAWDVWSQAGQKTMLDRAVEKQEKILREHTLLWCDEALQRELDSIVTAAKKELLNGG